MPNTPSTTNTASANKVINNFLKGIGSNLTDQEYDAVESTLITHLQAWQWDGVDIKDVTCRLNDFEHYSSLNKLEDLGTSLPVDLQSEISFVEWENPVNSMEQIKRSFKIIAVDKSNSALVKKIRWNTYTDDESESFSVMPLCDARKIITDHLSEAESAQHNDEPEHKLSF